MKNNDFAEHEFAVRHAASSTLRSHLDGTLDDQQEYGDGSSTGYRWEDNLIESKTEHERLVTATRVIGKLSILEYDKLAKGILGRTAARVEIGLGRIFDPYTRQALNSGIPQETALGVYTSSTINRTA